jgi:two-component system alkaline phosphatase synthesis response regulator PhoP
MGRILILSEKQDLSNQLKREIESIGHNAISTNFDDIRAVIHTRKPDLLLADLTLQGGIIEVWRRLRYELGDTHTRTIAFIPKDRIREIELLEGMTDFIVYPYDVRELEMRIKLVLKQVEEADSGDVIKIGNLVIDPAKYEVTVDGWPIVLTLKEYELLKYLAARRGRVITREVLLEQVWGYDYYGGTRTVDVHIGRLRTKIETGKYSFIKTVRGVGYVFTEEDFDE